MNNVECVGSLLYGGYILLPAHCLLVAKHLSSHKDSKYANKEVGSLYLTTILD